MFKKKLTYSFIFSLFLCSLFAQKERVENRPNFDKRPIHYGFYLGLNKNDFKFSFNNSLNDEDVGVTTEADFGFNVGLIGDLRLHKNINLRFEPGLISNTKTLYFDHIINENQATRTASNTYLHLPVIFKFSTDRLNNVRPYVLGGASFDYNFASNAKNNDDNFSGQFRQNSNMFMYELGIGIDLYLPYFKLSPSIRGLFAINNEIKYDNTTGSQWTDPIDFMGTRGVFLHLAFE